MERPRYGRSCQSKYVDSGREVFQIRVIERYANTRIQRATAPTLAQVDEARANAVLDKVRATLQSGEFKRQDQLVECLLEEGFTSTDIASSLLHLLQGGESANKVASQERGRVHQPLEREPSRPRSERSAKMPSESRFRPSEKPSSSQRQQPRERREPSPERSRLSNENSSPSPAKQKPGTASTPNPKTSQQPVPEPVPMAKSNRQTPEGQSRLYIKIGSENGVTEPDLVATILGHTGLSAQAIGTVDIRARHSFVDVASEHAHSIIAKLNRTEIKGHKARVKLA
jgi:ATP-dependent RNA helicase DeaD